MFARLNKGRAAARDLATRRPRHRAGRPWQLVPFAIAAFLAGAVAMPATALAADGPSVTLTNLTLLHGWAAYPGSASPAIADISGIVHFKGAITTSSSNTND